MRIFILRLFRPLFRHKLKKLEAFEGPETYAQQMKRHRQIAVFKASLSY
jgi:hypothetical protein